MKISSAEIPCDFGRGSLWSLSARGLLFYQLSRIPTPHGDIGQIIQSLAGPVKHKLAHPGWKKNRQDGAGWRGDTGSPLHGDPDMVSLTYHFQSRESPCTSPLKE
jgi:hypothetical protein